MAAAARRPRARPVSGLVAAVAVAVVVGGLGACGSPTVAPDAAAVAAIALDWDAFCLRMSAVELHREATCFNRWPDLAVAPSRLPICDFVAESLRAGRTRFGDGAAAADCLATIDVLGCDPSVALPSNTELRCPRLAQGTAPTGAPCAFSFDCAGPGSQTCMRAAGACAGICQPRRQLGGACTRDMDCVPALACDTTAHYPGVCEARLGVGAACGPGVGVCTGLLRCDGDTSVCIAYPAAGPCLHEICAPGFICRYDTPGADAGVCVPYQGTGDRCTLGNGDCQPPSACLPLPGAGATDGAVASGTCSPPPRVGDTCAVVLNGAEIIEQQDCLDGWCDRPAGALGGVCQPFRQLGDPCSLGTECDSSALRRCGTGGVCAAATCFLGD